jgi:uncharacterized protein (DUF2461 family)
MSALTDALSDAFDRAKTFRPYRNVRFAKYRTPYKTRLLVSRRQPACT